MEKLMKASQDTEKCCGSSSSTVEDEDFLSVKLQASSSLL